MSNLQSKRIAHIDRIKSMINRCKLENRDIDYKKFYVEIMSVLRVTERTAKEYIKVAQYELEKR